MIKYKYTYTERNENEEILYLLVIKHILLDMLPFISMILLLKCLFSSAMSQLRNLDDGAMVPSANGGSESSWWWH